MLIFLKVFTQIKLPNQLNRHHRKFNYNKKLINRKINNFILQKKSTKTIKKIIKFNEREF